MYSEIGCSVNVNGTFLPKFYKLIIDSEEYEVYHLFKCIYIHLIHYYLFLMRRENHEI